MAMSQRVINQSISTSSCSSGLLSAGARSSPPIGCDLGLQDSNVRGAGAALKKLPTDPPELPLNPPVGAETPFSAVWQSTTGETCATRCSSLGVAGCDGVFSASAEGRIRSPSSIIASALTASGVGIPDEALLSLLRIVEEIDARCSTGPKE